MAGVVLKPVREYDCQGWTEVNPGRALAPDGDIPYLNYCRHCGWAGSIALWHGTVPPGAEQGAHCPRCRGNDVGRLLPDSLLREAQEHIARASADWHQVFKQEQRDRDAADAFLKSLHVLIGRSRTERRWP